MSTPVRSTGQAALLAALALVVGGVAPAASADPASSPSAAGDRAASAAGDQARGARELPAGVLGGTSVTLVTGDVVHLTDAGEGRTGYLFVAAAGRDVGVSSFTDSDGHLHVIPTDVERWVPERLDPRLFDLTALVAAGLADGDATALPIAVDYTAGVVPVPGGPAPSADAVTPHGVAGDAHLHLAKTRAAELGAALALDTFPAGVDTILLDVPATAPSPSPPAATPAELYDLTIQIVDRDGGPIRDPGSGRLYVLNLSEEDGLLTEQYVEAGETDITYEVPAGEYAIAFQGELLGDANLLDLVELDAPQVAVAADTEVVLDARDAVEVTVDVGEPVSVDSLSVSTFRRNPFDDRFQMIRTGRSSSSRIFALPTARAGVGRYEFMSEWNLDGAARHYELKLTQPRQVRTDLHYVIHRRDIAPVVARYPAHPGDASSYLIRLGWRPYATVESASGGPVDTPLRRVEWLSAGDTVRWDTFVDLLRDKRHYPRAERFVESWFDHPIRPAARKAPTRDGDRMSFAIVRWEDSQGHRDPGDGDSNTHFSLYADEALVAEGSRPGRTYRVPAGEASYELVFTTHRSENDWPLSNDTTTRWAFSSATAADGPVPLPLLEVDYDIAANLRQLTAAPTPVRFEVHHAASEIVSPIVSLDASASLDGGETWVPVEVVDEGGGAYSTVIDLGPDAGPGDAVSLRVMASDEGGSSIDETIVNAYRIRGATPPR